jgi:uncharacterized protein with HEPN domain
MYSEIIISNLLTCLDHINKIELYFSNSSSAESFFALNNSINYDATLMRLQALGESIKRIEQKYPEVIKDFAYSETNNLIRFRDYVSHHYEQLEHEVIFDICKFKLPDLKNKWSY